MAKKARPPEPPPPAAERKRRTREHVIADLSVNHVERLVLRCGYTVQRAAADYGYDLWMETYQDSGEVEDDYVRLQLKASDSLREYELTQEDVFSFPVSARDYRLWTEAVLPVFFILYDARLEEAYWLDVQEFASAHPQDPAGKSVRLRVPRRHVLGVQTIRLMRQRKQQRGQDIRRHLRRIT